MLSPTMQQVATNVVQLSDNKMQEWLLTPIPLRRSQLQSLWA